MIAPPQKKKKKMCGDFLDWVIVGWLVIPFLATLAWVNVAQHSSVGEKVGGNNRTSN